jgi:hypothetical protein
VSPITRMLRPCLAAVEQFAQRLVVGAFDPQAYAFYGRMLAEAYEPNRHIDVLPWQRVIYVCVPKCASSRIKIVLSEVIGRSPQSASEANQRKLSGLRGPKHVGLSTFMRVATDPFTLRFSFVRNPYDRLVSCWADKIRGKPLVAGDSWIDQYLAWRRIDRSLPAGADRSLSFSEFVTFATATATRRIDAHWQLQTDLLHVPGVPLDFIGKVESFPDDFGRVLDHVGAGESLRCRAVLPFNVSRHGRWPNYYTTELADRVYRTYERDFDSLGYPRALTSRSGRTRLSPATAAQAQQFRAE